MKPTEQKREQAMARAREIYPMANEDDYPDNPNVNRLNRACIGAFGSGYDFAVNQFEGDISSLKEELQRVYKLVETWYNKADANEQCWAETITDYNAQRDRNKQLYEENERLKIEIKRLQQICNNVA